MKFSTLQQGQFSPVTSQTGPGYEIANVKISLLQLQQGLIYIYIYITILSVHGTTKFLIPKNVQIQILNTQIYLLFKPFTMAREYYHSFTSILLSIQVLYTGTNFGTIINNSLNNPDFIVLSP